MNTKEFIEKLIDKINQELNPNITDQILKDRLFSLLDWAVPDGITKKDTLRIFLKYFVKEDLKVNPLRLDTIIDTYFQEWLKENG